MYAFKVYHFCSEGSELQCIHFLYAWCLIYLRPEKVRCGVDMVLHPGFTSSGSSHKPVFMRQISRVTKVRSECQCIIEQLLNCTCACKPTQPFGGLF